MSLTHIEYGALASSEVMNDNFEYLDNRISTVAGNLTTNTSSLYSNIASVNSTLTAKNEELEDDIEELTEYAQSIRSDLNGINNSPDYARAVGIALPFTAYANGYVYAGVDGIDTYRYVYVNSRVVHGHCGYSGGKAVYSGSLFRVSAGDVVASDRSAGPCYFYPMKGV